VAVYLVRHASAGTRDDGDPNDINRSLDAKGARQADALAEALGQLDIAWVASSPSRRCLETVTPLAARSAINLEVVPDLTEGTPIERSWAILAQAASLPGNAVLCSHGDVIPELIHRAQRRGMEIHGKSGCSKGSIWRLSGWKLDAFATGKYLGTP
jgi:broad specificity phosphatase PhoE